MNITGNEEPQMEGTEEDHFEESDNNDNIANIDNDDNTAQTGASLEDTSESVLLLICTL